MNILYGLIMLIVALGIIYKAYLMECDIARYKSNSEFWKEKFNKLNKKEGK